MKAVRIHEFGGADKLTYEDAPVPEPGPGSVRVRVHAVAVNPVDWKIREGYLQPFLPRDLPTILGWDVSGVVDALGDGVTAVAVSDLVYAEISIASVGAYAEYALVPAEALAPKPSTLSDVEAASLPISALTAWQSLFGFAQLSAGQTVLIHAAAGGVGAIAVQLAHWKGARVIGTASARNHDFVRSLGADEVIDYNTTYFDEVVRDVDVVFDTIGGDTLTRSWDVLKPGGVLVSIVAQPDPVIAAQHNVRAGNISSKPSGADLMEIRKLVDAGAIKPVIGEVMPLADARRAHEISESKHARGKIVLTVAE